MNRWLARFSFSFFIFAGLLAWEIYNSLEGRRGMVPAWRLALYCVAAAIFVALGTVGVRERHRSPDDEREYQDKADNQN
jgi:hypothetical protein